MKKRGDERCRLHSRLIPIYTYIYTSISIYTALLFTWWCGTRDNINRHRHIHIHQHHPFFSYYSTHSFFIHFFLHFFFWVLSYPQDWVLYLYRWLSSTAYAPNQILSYWNYYRKTYTSFYFCFYLLFSPPLDRLTT